MYLDGGPLHMVSSASAGVGGAEAGIPVSLVGASAKLLGAMSSVSIAKLKWCGH